MDKKELSIQQASELLKESGKLFAEVFKHGTLVVEFYKPEILDLQGSHDKDEIYVIASGTGILDKAGEKYNFKTGDFLFVPANTAHWFEDFSEDFSTWVFFYGPVGGEKESEDNAGVL